MRVRKLTALIGAVLIFCGCLILYRMTDYTLYPQEDIARKFEEDASEPLGNSKSKVETSKSDITGFRGKLISLKQMGNKTASRICLKPTNKPNADVQMLEVYKELKFDNLDGGVWKQGWNIEYNPNRWNSQHKLRVFVIPHSHNDPGWLKTFEDYYTSQTRHILNNMVKKLTEDKRKKFVWAEISYFSLWWDEISHEVQEKAKRLIENNQLEIVTGGWVMNDEASPHYFSILTQLTEGHLWLKSNVNFFPKNSWCIDPFGESSAMPFILKKMGLENLVIQRVHYSVKKHLARNKLLEFRWRQFWDDKGYTDLFTHMMPFYSYDVPHTCGPDPKICCQFDFKRLPGHGVSCPWKVSPQIINKKNVASRAELLLNQYRKKAELYKTNVLLVPLGDDFRYDHVTEWNDQFDNYFKIFEYLNSKSSLNVEAQFGTLLDYFNALREETSTDSFPSLTGDFFTYADRDDHYWSGYFTSRPFHKRMDRVLMSYLRAAEIIFTLAWSSNSGPSTDWLLAPESGFAKLLRDARRSLSLFQHHDAVAGTARDYVVEDYAKKLLDAIHGSQHVIQQSTHFLLSSVQNSYNKDPEFTYFDMDEHQKYVNSLPEKKLIILREGEVKQVVLFNSLPYKRQEVVSIHVFTSYVKVTDSEGEEILIQVSPVFSQGSVMDESRYEISFVAVVPALGLTTYTIKVVDSQDKSHQRSYAEVKVFNSLGPIKRSVGFGEVSSTDASEFSLQNEHIKAVFSEIGLLKSVLLKHSGTTVPLHIDFIRYLARHSAEKSGAYLFLPEGEADIVRVDSPLIHIMEGPVLSRVHVELPNVKHTVTLYKSPGSDGFGFEIQNVVDIREQNNYEFAMRLSSHILSGDEFFTDLNGYQITKRKRFPKLPLQANYYPLPSMGFIEDDNIRMSVVTAQPLGVSSLKEGQMEIMQDRRLNQDDNRGLGQGVLDNKPTATSFRVLIEQRISCKDLVPSLPSLGSFVSSQSLLNPFINMIWAADSVSDLKANFAPVHQDLGVEVNLVLVRTIDEETNPVAGIIFHRSHIDTCFFNPLQENFHLKSGVINFNSFLPGHLGTKIQRTSLSFTEEGEKMDRREPLSVCYMDFLPLLIER